MSADIEGLCFVDTNIWLYAFIATQDVRKHVIAKEIIETQQIILSVQVLNEISVNLIKKAHMEEARLRALLQSFYRRYAIINLDEHVLLDASLLRSQYSFSFWDSLIVASARYSAADCLLTEDLQHGLVIEGTLRVINPFLP